MKQPTVIPGSLTYQSKSVTPSLIRNGLLYLERGLDGRDDDVVGVQKQVCHVRAINARPLNPHIDTHGFQLLPSSSLPSPLPNFLDSHDVIDRYYPHCEDVIKKSLGASHVFAFDHNVRSSTTEKKLSDSTTVQDAVTVVHADYTLTSAPERLERLMEAPLQNDTYIPVLEKTKRTSLIPREIGKRAKRFVIVNVWRNIREQPVRCWPLVCCHAQSVKPNEFATFEIRYKDRIGENYLLRNEDDNCSGEQHQWFIFPEMTRNEALLIKTWDSEGTLAKTNGQVGDDGKGKATCAFHSALEMDNPPEGEERWSIEVRCMALFD